MFGSVVIFGKDKAKAEISIVPFQSGSLTYTGAAQSPVWGGFDSNTLEIGGVTSGTNAGTYTATFTPKEGYVWSDGSAGAKSVTWTINRATVSVPSQKGSLAYTGGEQSPAWNNYDSGKMTIGGTSKATNAGTYTATFTPKANYQWPDGTTGARSVSWSIGQTGLAVPVQSGSLTYTGSAQSPSWSNYDSSKLTVGGTTSGTNAGTYTATFTPKPGYQWPDGTTETKSVSWTIGVDTLSVPSQKGSLTYTGSELTAQWDGYDSGKMTISGTSKATNAGTYTATFTPGVNYQWPDGTTGARSVSWSIGKAAGSLTLDKSSLTLDVSNLTGYISPTKAGNGAISATSSNTAAATVAIEDGKVKVTAKARGSATITVNVAAGTNHTPPASETCAVTVDLPSATLADNTPAVIQAAARAGVAPNYWSVGDKIGITLNGTVGALKLSGTYYAFIIGFNHNSSVEGDNSIHFQFGKTSDGTDIAFCDAGYGDYYGNNSNSRFVMNTSNTKAGGWESSYMRKTICAAFLTAMPAAWRDIIADCTKYSDNKGVNNSMEGINATSHVTSTSDQIWLLNEIEMFGSSHHSNVSEGLYTKQYDYYKNGNAKTRYKHDKTTTECECFLRSLYASTNNSSGFCVSHLEEPSTGNSDCSKGFAPCFMVA